MALPLILDKWPRKVARVAALWAALGRRVCDTNTGAYCRARPKLPFAVVSTIAKQLAADVAGAVDHDGCLSDEQAANSEVPSVVADVKSQPTTGRILLVDGFTCTAADTPENQEKFPQNPAQEEGFGFPILRCVSLISMTTGLLVDLAVGPYRGKPTRACPTQRARLRQNVCKVGDDRELKLIAMTPTAAYNSGPS